MIRNDISITHLEIEKNILLLMIYYLLFHMITVHSVLFAVLKNIPGIILKINKFFT